MEAGSGRLHIEGRTYDMEPNSLFYCCGGSRYWFERRGALSLICINFDLTRDHRQVRLPLPVVAQKDQWDRMPVYHDPVEDSPFLGSHLWIGSGSWLYRDFQEMTAAYADNTELSRELCGSILRTVLLRLHRQQEQLPPPQIACVRDYIHRHYAEELSNRQLAELVGYHEYYLNRSFRAYVGTNLHQYLIKVRMNQALRLILNTELELSEIAEQVGFRSYPHFSSCFSKTYGCSPVQYRRTLRGSL